METDAARLRAARALARVFYAFATMTYAIISVGGKQYRVREGERLLVDRLRHDERKTFHPDVLLVGGDGDVELDPKGIEVTARVVAHPLGTKLRIGKYRPKTGYRRHAGHRSRLSQIEIEKIGKKGTAKTARGKAEPKPKAEERPKAKAKERPKAEAKAADKPKRAAATKKNSTTAKRSKET